MVIDLGSAKIKWKRKREKKLDKYNELLLEIAYRKLLFENGLLEA